MGLGAGLSIVGTLMSRFATLAILILLPGKIGHTQYGLFALVITAGEMIEMTTSNWYRLLLVRQGVINRSSDDQDGANPRGYAQPRFLTLILLTGVLFLALSAALGPLVVKSQAITFTFAIAVYGAAFIWFRLIVTLLQASGRQSLIGAIELLRGIFTFMLVMGVVYANHHSFAVPAFAMAAATILSGVVALPALRDSGFALLRLRLPAGAIVGLGMPIIFATLLTYQFGWIDRFLVQYWLGPQFVGLYVATMAIARQPVDILLNALNSQSFPVLMASIQQDLSSSAQSAGRQVAAVLVSLSILGFGAAAGLISLSPLMAKVFLPTFDQAVTLSLIPWLTTGAVMLGLKHFVFDNLFHAAGRNWLMLGWFAVSSFVALCLGFWLVPLKGVEGAAIAFCIGGFLGLASSLTISRRILQFELPLARLGAVAGAALLAGIVARWTSDSIAGSEWARLLAACCSFGAVYLGALVATIRFNLRHFLSSPWEQAQPGTV